MPVSGWWAAAAAPPPVDDGAWLLVPQTSFVHEETVTALRHRAGAVGRVAIVCNRSARGAAGAATSAAAEPDGCDHVLRYTPLGARRSDEELLWLRSLPTLDALPPSAQQLLPMLRRLLTPHARGSRLIRCVTAEEPDDGGDGRTARPPTADAHGVLCRTSTVDDVVFVINLLRRPARVRLVLRTPSPPAGAAQPGRGAGQPRLQHAREQPPALAEHHPRHAIDLLSGQRISLRKPLRLAVRAVRVLKWEK